MVATGVGQAMENELENEDDHKYELLKQSDSRSSAGEE